MNSRATFSEGVAKAQAPTKTRNGGGVDGDSFLEFMGQIFCRELIYIYFTDLVQ